MSRRALTLLLSAFLAAVLAGAAFVTRVPYVALTPGPVFDTLGTQQSRAVIEVKNAKTYPTTGQLDLTTVGVRNDVTLADALLGWFHSQDAIVPREILYPPGQSDTQVMTMNAKEMKTSTDSATLAALGQLGLLTVRVSKLTAGSPSQGQLQADDLLLTVDGQQVGSRADLVRLIQAAGVGKSVRIGYRRGATTGTATVMTAAAPDSASRAVIGVEVDVADPKVQVSFGLQGVGGPSAGTMFALGIYDKLTPGALTGGRHIAGTGTITPDGVVGPIGGIQQKLVAARADGATVFLVPDQDCAQAVGAAPDGLQLIRIGTLSDALAGLAAVRDGKPVTGCS